MTWFTVSTKTTCSRPGVGKRSLTETAMMLQSLTVFPTEEQAIYHAGQGTVEGEQRAVLTRLSGRYRALSMRSERRQDSDCASKNWKSNLAVRSDGEARLKAQAVSRLRKWGADVAGFIGACLTFTFAPTRMTWKEQFMEFETVTTDVDEKEESGCSIATTSRSWSPKATHGGWLQMQYLSELRTSRSLGSEKEHPKQKQTDVETTAQCLTDRLPRVLRPRRTDSCVGTNSH